MTDAPPRVDTGVLDELRRWVGADTVASLIAEAPHSFASEIATIRAAWLRRDLAAIRDGGHRLKGAAASLGCRSLAQMGQDVQVLAPESMDDAGWPERLDAEARLTIEELERHAPDQPQRTPVPPNPQ